MQTVHLFASHKPKNLQCWSTWDESAGVYELWSDPDCQNYIGCADTRKEALAVAFDWFDDPEAHMWNLHRVA